MLAKLARIPLLLIFSACLAMAQDEEEDMAYAVGVMGMKVAQVVEGDFTDRSADFPKNPYGDLTKGIYQFIRRATLRNFDTEIRLDKTQIMKVASLEWSNSPKAAIRELAKASAIYSNAKLAFRADVNKLWKLMDHADEDTPNMRNFKAGMKVGFQRTVGGQMDMFTPSLIFLSRLEDIYHHIDQNKADIMATMGPLVFFKTESNNLAFEQKIEAMGKAAEIVERLYEGAIKNQEDAVKRMRGGVGNTNG